MYLAAEKPELNGDGYTKPKPVPAVMGDLEPEKDVEDIVVSESVPVAVPATKDPVPRAESTSRITTSCGRSLRAAS